MCIALYSSEVPLQIQFMQEHVLCDTKSGEFKAKEFYDVVLTNRGTKQITSIMLISPHFLFIPQSDPTKCKPSVSLLSVAGEDFLNWYMKEEGVKGPILKKDRLSFTVPRYPDPVGQTTGTSFECVPISGKAKIPKLLKNPNIWKPFLELKYTVAEIHFSKPLKPYGKNGLCYWMRILLEPQFLNHQVGSKKLLTGFAWPQISVQPCEIACPSIVLDRLRVALEKSVKTGREKNAFQEMQNQWVRNGFDMPNHISWVEDHRMTVIPDKRSMLMCVQQVGAVAFFRVHNICTEDTHARTWHAGLHHFPEEDSFYIGAVVYRWLKEGALNTKDAITSIELAHELSLPPEYVNFALTALEKNGYISRYDGNKFYCRKRANLDDDDNQTPLRIIMAKRQPPAHRGYEELRFPGKPYIVNFDYLWYWTPTQA